MYQFIKEERGQSVVIMALAMVVLVGMLAVAIDGGRIYTLRRDAQNAADAAALQGARALCRDEDYEKTAFNVAARGGFSEEGTVEVNHPPVWSDSPVYADDQVEVVITATIGGGLIAPVVYNGELTTQVIAVGDCLRGDLTGSGSAVFAGAQDCPGIGYEVDLNGSSITIIGGIHTNDDIQITGGGQGNVVTGTVSHTGNSNIDGNTKLFPSSGNPVQVIPKEYPIEIAFADFLHGGWAYDAIIARDPDAYHLFPMIEDPVGKQDFIDEGWIDNNMIEPGVYVSAAGFKFSGSTGNGLIGDGVTFVSLGTIDFSGNSTMLRPYFSGLLMFTEGWGNKCDSNAVIKMSGSTVNWGGIIFAPYGNVNMSFSNNSTFFGSIIGGTVDVSGSTSMIIYDPSYLPPDPDTIELGQ